MTPLTSLRTFRTGILSLPLAAAAVAFAAVAAGPSARAQAPDAAARQVVQTAHAEAREALRAGSVAPLRSYTPDAVAQIAGQLAAYADYGAVVTNASDPAFVAVRVEGARATVVTRTALAVTFYGVFSDTLVAEITWHLAAQGGRWLVAGLAIEL